MNLVMNSEVKGKLIPPFSVTGIFVVGHAEHSHAKPVEADLGNMVFGISRIGTYVRICYSFIQTTLN